jgi:hypothetical protein
MGPLEFVLRPVDAFNRRDVDQYLDCYADQVVIEDGRGYVLARGKEAYRPSVATLFERSPNLHCCVFLR